MKKIFLVLLCTAAASLQAPAVDAQTGRRAVLSNRGVLAQGANLQVRLTQRLDSDTNRTGDTFDAVLDEDIVSDGRILARSGNPVRGHLVEVQPAGRVSGRARMVLTLTGLQSGDVMVPIETNNLTVEADESKRKDVGVIGGGAALGAIIGAIAGGGKGAAIGAIAGAAAGTAGVLVMPGRDVEFEPEQQFNFILEQGVTLDDTRTTRGRRVTTRGEERHAAELARAETRDDGSIDDIARMLNERAQHVWQMAQSRREDFRTLQGEEGMDLYLALSDFANLTQNYAGSATGFRRESLRRGARRLISHAEQLSGMIDRVEATLHFRNDWRAVENQLARLADVLGVEYTGARALPRSDPARRDNGYGSLRWRGQVDGTDEITLRGTRVTVRHLEANPIADSTFDVTGALPRAATSVRLNLLRGRGRVELVQQPSAANNYAATVRIEDRSAGSDFYELELTWDSLR